MLLMTVSLVFGNSSLSFALVDGSSGSDIWKGRELPLVFHWIATAEQINRRITTLVITNFLTFS